MAQQIRQTRLQSAKNTLPNPPVKSRKKLRLTLVVLLLAFVGVGSALLYHHHAQQLAINKERAQFAQTEKDLDQLTANIVTTFGEPSDTVKDKTCRHKSNFSEIGKGKLYCNVTIYTNFGVKSKEDAQDLSARISTFLHQSGLENFQTQEANDNSPNPPIQLRADSYSDNNGMECNDDYIYYTNGDNIDVLGYAKTIPGTTGQNMLIGLSCGVNPAKAPYYPIKD